MKKKNAENQLSEKGERNQMFVNCACAGVYKSFHSYSTKIKRLKQNHMGTSITAIKEILKCLYNKSRYSWCCRWYW